MKFVDYGNIEVCDFEDLRHADILGHIPIQGSRYCLEGIRPITRSSRINWTVDITDFLHRQIVDLMCSICVSNVEAHRRRVVPCKLTVGGIEIRQLLLDNGLVEELLA